MTWSDDLVVYSVGQVTSRERDALYARGVTDEQMALYQIGYVNRQLPPLDGAEDFLSWAHQGAKLDDMFVFPLTTMQGSVKGFQFRHVEKERKGYTDFFLGQDEPVLFGLHQAMPHIWRSGQAFLVEGVFDVFPLQRHVPWIFPTMTAKVTVPVSRMLRRLIHRLWLGYDMDARGRRACVEFVREHGQEIETHIVEYPKLYKVGSKELIKDPGDLWEIWGDTRVKEFLKSTIELLKEKYHAEDLRYR